MKIVGCDLHAKQQTIAMVDTATGEFTEKTLSREGNQVREFYAALEGPVVVGIEPPYVATDLLNGASDPHAMPLDKFIVEVMVILKTQPAVVEICVENVKRLRFAAENRHHDSVFRGLNEAMANTSH